MRKKNLSINSVVKRHILGLLRDETGSYLPVFVFCASMMAFCSIVFACEPCVRRLETRHHGHPHLDQLEWDDDTWAEFERHQPIGRSNPNLSDIGAQPMGGRLINDTGAQPMGGRLINDTGGAGDAGAYLPNSVPRRLDMGPGASAAPNTQENPGLQSDTGASNQPQDYNDTVPNSQPVWKGRGRAICNSTGSLQHSEREIR